MATFLIDLSQREMADRLGDALHIYVTAMRYPPGTENHRAALWLEHTRRRGWQAVAAIEAEAAEAADAAEATAVRSGRPADPRGAPLLGVAYGYRGSPDQWWQQQVVLGLQRRGYTASAIAALTADYFELTEVHIAPHAQGRGIGEALIRRLLAGRTEAAVLLSTPEVAGEDNRAWRLYRRLGFTDVIRDHRFTGDPRAFAILGRPLPL